MLTVEDCLEVLNSIVGHKTKYGFTIQDKWDRQFISDIAKHTSSGSNMSTTQADVIVKLIDRYRLHLSSVGIREIELKHLLTAPIFRKNPYQSTPIPREVRYIGGNYLAFRCKFNSNIVDDLKLLRNDMRLLRYQYPIYNQEYKLWIVPISSLNLDRVMSVIKRYKFDFDSGVENFLLEVTNTIGATPTIDIVDDSIEVVVQDDILLAEWTKLMVGFENVQ